MPSSSVASGSSSKKLQRHRVRVTAPPSTTLVRTKDIKTELADLEAKGVKATGAPRQDPNVPTTFATFIEGATGRIEMTQR